LLDLGGMMEKIDLILFVISGGFAINFGLMLVMWNSLSKRIDGTDSKIDNVDFRLSNKIDKLDEKLTDVDRRLCRLEGAFSSKDCCMIKDDKNIRKAE
jgi:hypothetical protein